MFQRMRLTRASTGTTDAGDGNTLRPDRPSYLIQARCRPSDRDPCKGAVRPTMVAQQTNSVRMDSLLRRAQRRRVIRCIPRLRFFGGGIFRFGPL